MTTDLIDTAATASRWLPATGAAVRGTLILLPGRGEHGGVYERFGRRLAADGYAVYATDRPDELAGGTPAGPVVLAGSDTGALRALLLAGRAPSRVDGVLLAGTASAGTASAGTGTASAGTASAGTGTASAGVPARPTDWARELEARTACPVHRNRLDEDPRFTRGGLDQPVPAELAEVAGTGTTGLPVLILHGADDPVSPLSTARVLAARLPRAELVIVHSGRHDVLNDASHRSVAAQVVQWLERLRGGPDAAPILTVAGRGTARF